MMSKILFTLCMISSVHCPGGNSQAPLESQSTNTVTEGLNNSQEFRRIRDLDEPANIDDESNIVRYTSINPTEEVTQSSETENIQDDSATLSAFLSNLQKAADFITSLGAAATAAQQQSLNQIKNEIADIQEKLSKNSQAAQNEPANIDDECSINRQTAINPTEKVTQSSATENIQDDSAKISAKLSLLHAEANLLTSLGTAATAAQQQRLADIPHEIELLINRSTNNSQAAQNDDD